MNFQFYTELYSKLSYFLTNKPFKNPRSKIFLYHGTNIKPSDFILIDDYDGVNSNVWYSDLPEGYLFLTTDIKEAKAYGLNYSINNNI